MTTLIIGGGLSGLALADALERQGQDYALIEARDRFGGRILTEHYGAGYFDMGPAWFWPGQPRIADLVDRLGLRRFDQYAKGALAFEDETGQVQLGRGFASMQGSWRLQGGLGALIRMLADGLPAARKRLNAQVMRIDKTDRGATVHLRTGKQISGDHVVFALPPRVTANIRFEPALPAGTMTALAGVSTWMAGQAKALAVYDRPFWREAGLSGDATSRFGPMVEIHDASPNEGGPCGLFGFIGVPPAARRDDEKLRQAILAQLVRIFGPEAQAPLKLFVKDWAFDLHTATPADQAPLYAHPTYGLPAEMIGLWGGTLHFSGTEVAPQFGGYIEGALEAAENTLQMLRVTTDAS